jgi:RNA-directed DNA polymerase
LHNGEKVELHHIKPIKDGGTYAVSNIQPLHQICHISVTHRNKNLKKKNSKNKLKNKKKNFFVIMY